MLTRREVWLHRFQTVSIWLGVQTKAIIIMFAFIMKHLQVIRRVQAAMLPKAIAERTIWAILQMVTVALGVTLIKLFTMVLSMLQTVSKLKIQDIYRNLMSALHHKINIQMSIWKMFRVRQAKLLWHITDMKKPVSFLWHEHFIFLYTKIWKMKSAFR